MRRDLDLSLLRTFVVVAENRSMTAASNVLHITQGAVSQQVSRLEATLGRTLLVRDRRGLRPTPDGERLIGRARALLGLHDELWAEMTGDEPSGRVRLGVPFDLVGTVLPPVIRSFTADRPDVELSLVCGSSPSLIAAVDDASVDLAVVEVPITAGREYPAVEQLVWVGAPDGVAHAIRPLPVSLVSDTCAFRPSVLDALRAERTSWRSVFDGGTLEATLATVRMDLAVTVSLAPCVPGDLRVLEPGAGLPELGRFGIELRHPAHTPAPAVRELAGRIDEALARGRARVPTSCASPSATA